MKAEIEFKNPGAAHSYYRVIWQYYTSQGIPKTGRLSIRGSTVICNEFTEYIRQQLGQKVSAKYKIRKIC